ncbi:MAG: ASKHA domain-containing protein [Bacillota bacterium]
MKKHRVIFLPDQVEVVVPEGTSLLQAIQEAGLEFEGPCGGKGTCGKCRAKIIEAGGQRWILACQSLVTAGMTVEIPKPEVYLARNDALTAGLPEGKPSPGITKLVVQVEAPSLSKQLADAERLLQSLPRGAQVLKLAALRDLPAAVRKENGLTTIVLEGNQVLAVEAGDTGEHFYGLAVDIGTTTVMAGLLDLHSGKTMVTVSAGNTQNIFGADVISRIEYAMQGSKQLGQLQRRVIQVINRLIRKAAVQAGISEKQIYLAAVVGNTTMSHLFLGVDPRHLAPAPFIPAFTGLVRVEAWEIGLSLAPHAPVYLLPNIAGYVGGDTVGVILATDLHQGEGNRLAVDIGTNGEIVLASSGRLITCSTAAGPAFEGAQIKHGMRAQAGAIEGVTIDEDVSLRVIGDVPAKGICGSGLMDAVAELVRHGIIEKGGRLLAKEEGKHLPPALQKRLGLWEGNSCFILATEEETGGDPVVLTQKDVREVQLAKGAIRAGIQVLLDQLGLTAAELDEVLLAGAFGTYLNKKSALEIGLLPPVDPAKIRAVGNAAGAGAVMALLSAEIREKAVKVAAGTEHLELSARRDFQEEFLEALYF